MYDLPTIYQLLQQPPAKLEWKRIVRSAMDRQWEQRMKDDAREMVTVKYLNLDSCRPGKLHPVWDTSKTDKINTLKMTVHAKILADRYPYMAIQCKNMELALTVTCVGIGARLCNTFWWNARHYRTTGVHCSSKQLVMLCSQSHEMKLC